MKRTRELDGIRGFAILSVLIWHYYVSQIDISLGYVHAVLSRVFMLSWSGVDLFFVLSGFLIGGIILDNRGSTNFFSVFYLRRSCRILPIYVLWVVLFYFAQESAVKNVSPWLFQDPLPYWSYLTYTQNFIAAATGTFGAHWLGISWTLAIEEQFYLVFPILVLTIPSKKLMPILLCLIFCAPVFRILTYFVLQTQGFAGHVLLPGRWDSLLLGAVAAQMVRDPLCTKKLRSSRGFLNFLLALFAAIVLVMIVFNIQATTFAMTAFGHTLLALGFAVIILHSVSHPDSYLAAVLRLHWLRIVGLISYGVYLYHQGISGILHGGLLGREPRITDIWSASTTMLSLLLTFVVAWASYYYLEKPIINWGHRSKYLK